MNAHEAARYVEDKTSLAKLELLTAGLGILVGFLLGRRQDRQQMRHEAAVKVLMELRRRILDVEREFGPWVFASAEGEDYASEKSERIADLLEGLQRYHKENTPWLELRTIEKLQPIMSGYVQGAAQTLDVARGRKTDPEPEAVREELLRWTTQDLTYLMMDLEDEARRLIGSDRRNTRRPYPIRLWRRGKRRLSRSHRR